MNQATTARARGQVLVGVILVLMALLVMVPALVEWVQHESRAAVKDQKTGTAFNLAQAAIERGMWKLKSSTSTWNDAQTAIVIPGYDFDVTYADLPGGTYRIQFSSSVLNGTDVVIVWGEGRDSAEKETRSIQAVYQNLIIPAAIIANSNIAMDGSSGVSWGPVMAMGDITLSGTAATKYHPRKLSKQTVIGTGGQPRDINLLVPPNTDNLEWWSDYDVPELPLFNFTALRSSAIATNTLNCSGSYNATTGRVPCNITCASGLCNVKNIYGDSRNSNNYIWYWDNNVIIEGAGIKGTTIVRGNLTLTGADRGNVSMVMNVPADAWMEYQKFDNASTNQYPGDSGMQTSAATYTLGSASSLETSVGDTAFNGFVYVGNNITMMPGSQGDIYGAIWVVGTWTSSSNNEIFFNDKLSLPTLNVVLRRKSWKEVMPSAIAWP